VIIFFTTLGDLLGNSCVTSVPNLTTYITDFASLQYFWL